jgi:hypothetical protein
MPDNPQKRDADVDVELSRFGVPIETALERREKLADNYAIDFGQERVFPELVDALTTEVSGARQVLEVGAATGLITRPLVGAVGYVTALEPSEGMLRRLVSSDVAEASNLRTMQGLVEDLPPEIAFDVAVVTFTPRRGVALVRLLLELATRVADRIVMMLDDTSLDWAYLARSAAAQGFGVRMRLVVAEDGRRAVLLVADVSDWSPSFAPHQEWTEDVNSIEVPYPTPRGAATRLVRYFLAGGDRALVLTTDPRGLDRLYGNLRTAVHRLAREEVTVRRQEENVQLVRLPGASEEDRDVSPMDEAELFEE